MVVVVRRGPARPVMTGLLVGGAIHRSRERQRDAARTQQEIAQANASAARAQEEARQAQKEAEKARKSAEAATEARATVVTVSAPAMQTVNVTVPAGVSAGMPFAVNFQGQTYNVTCPAGCGAGSTLAIQLPAPAPAPVAVASAAPQVQMVPAPAPSAPAPAFQPYPSTLSAGQSGTDLLRDALFESSASAPPPPALSYGANELELVADHLVDENSPTMRQYGIISLSKGTRVVLVEGDLVQGLGGSYKDYIKVSVPSQGGRAGLISRLVVRPAGAGAPAAPPPAIGF